MKIYNDGISRGHSTKILKLESIPSLHSMRSNANNNRDSSPSHNIKKKLTDYFVFSNTANKQQLMSSIPDKKIFLEEIGKIRINQKLSHIFPESAPSTTIVKKSSTNKVTPPCKPEHKITIMDLNPLVLNTTEENVSSGIVYDEPALDDYFYNKENRYNYIESLTKESVLKAAPMKMVNDKFKKLQTKLQKSMSKPSNLEDNSNSLKLSPGGVVCGVQSPTSNSKYNFSNLGLKPRDKITNLNLCLNLDKSRIHTTSEEDEIKKHASLKSRFRNSLLRSCLENCHEDQMEEIILPTIENRGLSNRARMRHLVGKSTKLKKYLKSNPGKRLSL